MGKYFSQINKHDIIPRFIQSYIPIVVIVLLIYFNINFPHTHNLVSFF